MGRRLLTNEQKAERRAKAREAYAKHPEAQREACRAASRDWGRRLRAGEFHPRYQEGFRARKNARARRTWNHPHPVPQAAKARRLAKVKAYDDAKRASETPEAKEVRLRKQRERMAALRAKRAAASGGPAAAPGGAAVAGGAVAAPPASAAGK